MMTSNFLTPEELKAKMAANRKVRSQQDMLQRLGRTGPPHDVERRVDGGSNSGGPGTRCHRGRSVAYLRRNSCSHRRTLS